MSDPPINTNALRSEIRQAIINQKANACPMIVRLAWHASGTYDGKDGSGGSDGATMRFEPESTDDANAGLSIVRDMLLPVKANHPEISFADLWTFAGTCAVEFLGGPQVPHEFGRGDAASGARCPANGRLPDAAQGAQHLRDVFYRMGFNDQEIVALSGAHTLGRCHRTRSGFDGPWTRNPLKFDNTYFRVLMHMNWVPKKWDGPLQYEDEDTGELMMLPTDMCLKSDPSFKVWAEKYAKDEALFFDHFADAFAKLIANGATTNPKAPRLQGVDEASAEFREAAMHGSLDVVKKFSKTADVHAKEKSSGRTALHKAAFWGHDGTIEFLTKDCGLDVNMQDYNGDSPLHDAARFGGKDTPHYICVQQLVAAGSSLSLQNKAGQTPLDVAIEYGKTETAAFLRQSGAGMKSRL